MTGTDLMVINNKMTRLQLRIGVISTIGLGFFMAIWVLVISVDKFLDINSYSVNLGLLFFQLLFTFVLFFMFRFIQKKLVVLAFDNGDMKFYSTSVDRKYVFLLYEFIFFSRVYGVIEYKSKIYFVAPDFYMTRIPIKLTKKIRNPTLLKLKEVLERTINEKG